MHCVSGRITSRSRLQAAGGLSGPRGLVGSAGPSSGCRSQREQGQEGAARAARALQAASARWEIKFRHAPADQTPMVNALPAAGRCTRQAGGRAAGGQERRGSKKPGPKATGGSLLPAPLVYSSSGCSCSWGLNCSGEGERKRILYTACIALRGGAGES